MPGTLAIWAHLAFFEEQHHTSTTDFFQRFRVFRFFLNETDVCVIHYVVCPRQTQYHHPVGAKKWPEEINHQKSKNTDFCVFSTERVKIIEEP